MPDFTIDWGDSHLVSTVNALAWLGLIPSEDLGTLGARIASHCERWLQRTVDEFPAEPHRWPLSIFSGEGWQVALLPVHSDDPIRKFRAHVSIHPPALLRAIANAGVRRA
ncbi:MAG: hypothetical protein ACO4B5_11455 [Steroidobacteraceae bacterium]